MFCCGNLILVANSEKTLVLSWDEFDVNVCQGDATSVIVNYMNIVFQWILRQGEGFAKGDRVDIMAIDQIREKGC